MRAGDGALARFNVAAFSAFAVTPAGGRADRASAEPAERLRFSTFSKAHSVATPGRAPGTALRFFANAVAPGEPDVRRCVNRSPLCHRCRHRVRWNQRFAIRGLWPKSTAAGGPATGVSGAVASHRPDFPQRAGVARKSLIRQAMLAGAVAGQIG
jgi:hypothetical protein